jgi:hypothetical protein
MQCRAPWRFALLLSGVLSLTACRQSLVPLPTPSQEIVATLKPTGESSPVPQPTIQTSPEYSYAVVWVPSESPLQVRQPAGITSMEVDSLASDQRGIALTGKMTQLGSSTWVEIFRPQGSSGWVNGWNLTEDVDAETFCSDPRVPDLANRFILALQDRNGVQLAQMASPKRGLIIRHDWWNPEVQFDIATVSAIFQNPANLIWGVNRDSEQPIDGSFRDVILPSLEDVFSIAPEMQCNGLGVGSTAQEAIWPSEFTNLNYLSFHRPAPQPGNALNWRTWALGIEYVAGQPYIAIAIQYRGEI